MDTITASSPFGRLANYFFPRRKCCYVNVLPTGDHIMMNDDGWYIVSIHTSLITVSLRSMIDDTIIKLTNMMPPPPNTTNATTGGGKER
jgi:hypothetical protein